VNRRHFTEDEKATARQAMSDWTRATGNKVRFQEIDPTMVQSLGNVYGVYPYVTLYVDSGVPAGLSTYGVMPLGVNYLRINPANTTDAQTYLHELGHILGLMHEHQRPDRDTYVTIPPDKLSDKKNYGKIPEKTVVIGIKTVNLLFVKVTIPWIWYTKYGVMVGGFDYDSIMIYPSVIKKSTGKENGRRGTISATDAATVKKMY
jgi:hypothetical protein